MTKEQILAILKDIENYCWVEEISRDIEKIKEYINTNK